MHATISLISHMLHFSASTHIIRCKNPSTKNIMKDYPLVQQSQKNIEKDKDMKKLLLFYILSSAALMIVGCSSPDQYEWIPWYTFRGHCYLELNIAVDSQPADAKVFINGCYKGNTPNSFVYESAPYIAGEKRKIPVPQNGSVRFETRDTEFLKKTKIEIMVMKQGYKSMKKTIIMEDNFPSDALDHEKKYEKSIRLTYSLKKQS